VRAEEPGISEANKETAHLLRRSQGTKPRKKKRIIELLLSRGADKSPHFISPKSVEEREASERQAERGEPKPRTNGPIAIWASRWDR
jgi:hypothetical protein